MAGLPLPTPPREQKSRATTCPVTGSSRIAAPEASSKNPAIEADWRGQFGSQCGHMPALAIRSRRWIYDKVCKIDRDEEAALRRKKALSINYIEATIKTHTNIIYRISLMDGRALPPPRTLPFHEADLADCDLNIIIDIFPVVKTILPDGGTGEDYAEVSGSIAKISFSADQPALACYNCQKWRNFRQSPSFSARFSYLVVSAYCFGANADDRPVTSTSG